MKLKKILCIAMIFCAIHAAAFANLKLRVVAVNPSDSEVKTTQVKIFLPQEVLPGDIIDSGGLDVEYDEVKSIYFVYKNNVELNPRETRVYEVLIKDVWLIPEDELSFARRRTNRILEKLEETAYYGEAAQIADMIQERLEEVATGQNDESMSREGHIGLYRTNLEVMDKVDADINRLEKLLVYVGGPPAPELLEESSLKSDSPSRTTTWMIIFVIMGFIGLIGFVFFFTWHKQAQMTEKVLLNARETSFPEEEESWGDEGLEGLPGKDEEL